jgi:hypothetical protein
LADGPVLGRFTVPPGFPAGLEAGAVAAGADAGGAGWVFFLSSAFAMLAIPRSPVRISAAETFLIVLRVVGMVIGYLFLSRF